jgi:hypothetical protein
MGPPWYMAPPAGGNARRRWRGGAVRPVVLVLHAEDRELAPVVLVTPTVSHGLAAAALTRQLCSCCGARS